MARGIMLPSCFAALVMAACFLLLGVHGNGGIVLVPSGSVSLVSGRNVTGFLSCDPPPTEDVVVDMALTSRGGESEHNFPVISPNRVRILAGTKSASFSVLGRGEGRYYVQYQVTVNLNYHVKHAESVIMVMNANDGWGGIQFQIGLNMAVFGAGLAFFLWRRLCPRLRLPFWSSHPVGLFEKINYDQLPPGKFQSKYGVALLHGSSLGDRARRFVNLPCDGKDIIEIAGLDAALSMRLHVDMGHLFLILTVFSCGDDIKATVVIHDLQALYRILDQRVTLRNEYNRLITTNAQSISGTLPGCVRWCPGDICCPSAPLLAVSYARCLPCRSLCCPSAASDRGTVQYSPEHSGGRDIQAILAHALPRDRRRADWIQHELESFPSTYQPQSAKRVCMFVFYQVTTVVIMILFSTPTAVLIYVKLDTHSAVYAIFTHDISSILAKFITSYLPSLLLITVNWCLLTSLFYLTTVEPWLSESERMKSFLNKGFSYLLLSSIVLPSIGVTAVYLATDQGASLHHGSEAAYIERFMFQLCRNFFIAYVCQRWRRRNRGVFYSWQQQQRRQQAEGASKARDRVKTLKHHADDVQKREAFARLVASTVARRQQDEQRAYVNPYDAGLKVFNCIYTQQKTVCDDVRDKAAAFAKLKQVTAHSHEFLAKPDE
ncbi:hypothetical protein DYB28_002919 [Aphanomyces astaci]|uniref:CSC1/OSCA1-like 7TM region domain-containing protein n=1 Tax=Aphanomyces astaci TaxID=112090 RepID=A0A9X8H7X7_APHAT|nr:hypothetical protein DYB28_002919 [Aphanomyces astaci]